jgi:hypothetical protein
MILPRWLQVPCSVLLEIATNNPGVPGPAQGSTTKLRPWFSSAAAQRIVASLPLRPKVRGTASFFSPSATRHLVSSLIVGVKTPRIVNNYDHWPFSPRPTMLRFPY